MHLKFPMTLMALMIGATGMTTAQAYEGDWKRGRVYYRGVCTTCHTAQGSSPISPNARTMDEWSAYLKADKHAGGKDTVSQYVGKAYRDSIKESNKAAEKYADVPDEELMEDVRVFLLKGAKDGDSPASCS
ncbi:MAG: hypothetical protein KJ558_04025 [Gammaproteobacteria bacterium]|nr:hypothetical protein [Gammaproteobacteria bacterium]MBU1653991.1 hypothetical protein [Gammaproteobacteria bacterium]MBU1960457.1 hypothetical protein [Gammaproteobacteria bacterium]